MHFFESTDHELGLQSCLEAGAVPLKYAYAGSAAMTHLRLSKTSGYQNTNWQVSQELSLLLEGAPQRLVVCEFGPGDGVHSRAVLAELVRHREIAAYCGFDFARTLMLHAYEEIRQVLPAHQIDLQCIDVEHPFSISPNIDRTGTQLIFLMLGGLLGNVEDPLAVLRNINSAIPGNCALLISVSAFNPKRSDSEYLAPYRTKEFESAALEPLLAIGLPINSYKFDVAWDQLRMEVRGIITLQEAWQPAMSRTPLNAGREIRIFTSRRFTAADLRNLIKEAGFCVERELLVEKEDRLQLIVRK